MSPGTARRRYVFVLNNGFLEEKSTSTYLPQEKSKNGDVRREMDKIGFGLLSR